MNKAYTRVLASDRRLDLGLMVALIALNFSYQFLRHDLVTAGEGFGWDGVLYGRIAADISLIFSGLGERAHRILPSVLVHGVLVLLQLKPTNDNVIVVFQFFNFFLLLIALFGYRLVAAHENLRRATEWIGFFAVFVIFPTAKFPFYYPTLTDVFALTLALWAAYFGLKRTVPALFLVLLLASYTWSSMFPWLACLLLFKPGPIPTEPASRWLARLAAGSAAAGYLSVLLVSYFVLGYRAYVGGTFYDNWLLLSALVGALYVYAGIYCVFQGIGRTGLAHMLRSISWQGGILLLVAVAIDRLVLQWVPGSSGTLTPLRILFVGGESIFIRSATLPGIFLVAHCVYWGPMFLLLGIFWRDICRLGRQRGVGIIGFLVLSTLVSITSESRHVLHAYPLVVILCLAAMQERMLERKLLPIVVVGSILASKLWYQITVEQMTDPGLARAYLEFPWQRYCMNFGPWMSLRMYLVQGGVALLFLGIIGALVMARSQPSPSVR